MKRAIHITAVRKEPPDLDRFVAALLALAIARVAEREKVDKAASKGQPRRGPQ